jgi:hypothetical protein
MEAMRQSWSDDRLDDLNGRVDRLTDRVDRLSDRVDAGFAEQRQEMDLRFGRLEDRFDRMQKAIIRVGGGLIGVLVASGAGFIATQI